VWISVVNVVCRQVEVSATGGSLVQRSPTECGVSECDREASTMRRPWPTRGCRATKKKTAVWLFISVKPRSRIIEYICHKRQRRTMQGILFFGKLHVYHCLSEYTLYPSNVIYGEAFWETD
jgi:hypothetical protein